MADLTKIDATVGVFCLEDFRPDMPPVSGRVALAHRLALRLQTPRGRFKPWPKFGTDMRQFLLSKAQPSAIASAAEAECMKDEQVDDASVKAELRDHGRQLRLIITVTDAAGPFTFTLLISQAAAELINLQSAA